MQRTFLVQFTKDVPKEHEQDSLEQAGNALIHSLQTDFYFEGNIQLINAKKQENKK